MHSTSHLVDANKGQFASFLAGIAQALGLPDSSELDEGSQEYSTVNGPVSLAISRQDEFLAAQWTTLSNSQLEFWDAFLVQPSSQKPKAEDLQAAASTFAVNEFEIAKDSAVKRLKTELSKAHLVANGAVLRSNKLQAELREIKRSHLAVTAPGTADNQDLVGLALARLFEPFR